MEKKQKKQYCTHEKYANGTNLFQLSLIFQNPLSGY